ncbi:uncharacterized protein LOC133516043 [Cydia pomonella]|uniref:uncharacterized protein LOC133516043 n=1 Tax=Cydia pomonella TaxID=82600 RepID=UPI002ADD8197|nr:uncharacterized protein LOC133516043 [Cydia pomonella]
MQLLIEGVVKMETIKILILAMASIMNITQSTPFNIKHFTKGNYLFSKGNPLESMSAFFFKLIPERPTRAAQKQLNASLPAHKAVKADFAIETVKPMLHNKAGCKHADYLTKFSYSINVPVMHPFEKYKIIVVTAPPYIKLSAGDTEPLVVYMIFNDDTTDDSRTPSMPEVYFLTQQNGPVDNSMKMKNDQIWIVNSNRTVTGLKSKDIAKFVSFRKKRGKPQAWRPMGP